MTEMTDVVDPTMDDVGRDGVWLVGDEEIEGTFLGLGSSRSDAHTTDCWAGCPGGTEHHAEHVQPRHLCGRCRWFEARIFGVGDRYLVSTVRATSVPGEQSSHRTEEVISEFEVMERLSGRRELPNGREVPYLSKPAARAIAQAAAFDDNIRDAYVDLYGT